ncbi:MAG: glycosyltransferase [Bacteroidota bacterium]|nr:glycosyltransferase [Bacteroidota bacterium]
MIRYNKLKTPGISVIIVVFNAVKHLESSILSVVNQTSSKIELIIIDGDSTDGSVDIIRKYQDKISYWISEPDKGIYDAMNNGWNHANYDNHILFLGAGDTIIELPSKSELKDDTVYFGDVILGKDSNTFVSKVDFRLKIGNTIHHQALLVPKKLQLKDPFNIKYKVYADFDFNQRLFKRKVRYIKCSKLKAYVLPDGFSQHYKTTEWYTIIKSNFGIAYAWLGYLYNQYQISRRKMPKIKSILA